MREKREETRKMGDFKGSFVRVIRERQGEKEKWMERLEHGEKEDHCSCIWRHALEFLREDVSLIFRICIYQHIADL